MTRKRGILQRERVSSGSRSRIDATRKKKKKRRRREAAEFDADERHRSSAAPHSSNLSAWGLASPVHKAAAAAIGTLMSASSHGSSSSGSKGKTLKSLTLFSSPTSTSSTSSNLSAGARRATHAVASETLRRLELLTLALKLAGYGKGNEEEGEGEGPSLPLSGEAVALRLPRPSALVLAYDLLFGEGLRPVGPAERAMLRAEGALRDALRSLSKDEEGEKEKTSASFDVSLARDSHPRAARVNSLKWSLEEALRCDWGVQQRKDRKEEGERGTSAARIAPRPDPLIEGVLLFPPRTDLHEHPAVSSGRLVLQSRASCLSAAALEPRKGWTVVDACAAPGNKTTHLAALVGPEGRVLAFDRDPSRLDVLRRSAERAGASGVVVAEAADFLQLDPLSDRFARVGAVLLDPSCSGSGTASADVDASIAAAEEAAREGEDAEAGRRRREQREQRLAKLASFQLSALKHALRFPAATRVAYSTCSVHFEENERVVAAALAWLRGEGGGERGERKRAPAAPPTSKAPAAPPTGWRLARALPRWPTRGISEGKTELSLSVEEAERVIRSDPLKDETDGFFIAVFER